MLVHNCYECHSGDPEKAKGDFVLDTRDGLRKGGDRAPAIVPGHADHSLLIEAIRYEALEMPPKGKLPDEAIDEFVRWVQMGAPDPRVRKGRQTAGQDRLGRSAASSGPFSGPRRSRRRSLHDTRWPLDRHRPIYPGPAGGRTSAAGCRRRSGHAHSPRDIRPDRPAADAGGDRRVRERQVAQCLCSRSSIGCSASSDSARRWGRHWLDVVRYGESTGKEGNFPTATPGGIATTSSMRSTPTNRTTGSSSSSWPAICCPPRKLGRDTIELLIATGFLAIGPKSGRD